MIWLSLALGGLLVIIAVLVGVVEAAWEDSAPAARAHRELADAYDTVDAVFIRAMSEMEDVAYRGERAWQPMPDSFSFSNWRKGWS